MNMKLLDDIQTQIETAYGIRIGEHASDYLISKPELQALMPTGQLIATPKELFLVNPNPQNDTLEVALFFDPNLQINLNTHNPLKRITNENISDFCSLIEGTSHFVYYLHKACLECEVTQLELELQAEIDKFVILSLLIDKNHHDTAQILNILFEEYELHKDMSQEQVERYKIASNLAHRYCYALSQTVSEKNDSDLLKEIRRFYPLTQEQKIKYILQ